MTRPELLVDFGALKSTDLEKLRVLLGYAFIQPRENVLDWIPDDFPLEWFLAGYVEDQLVTSTAILPMELTGRSRAEQAGGISGVATDPHYRGKGLARDLMQAALMRMRRQGMRWAMLYPFSFSFYLKLGWGQGTPVTKLTMGKDSISLKDEEPGQFRWVEPHEWQLLDRIHRSWAESGPGALLRQERDWKHIMHRPGRQRHTAVWHASADDHAGYLVYDLRRDKEALRDESMLAIVDWAWDSPEARNELLQYMARHSGQVGRIMVTVANDDPLTNLTGESIKAQPDRGPMIRIVDVGQLLEPGEEPARGAIHVKIEDSLCSWNDDTYWLLPGRSGLMGGHAAAETKDAQLSISTFSSLLWGSLTLDTAISCGLITGERRERLAIVEKSFPLSSPFFLDWF
jgi:predicted acetyltransferase